MKKCIYCGKLENNEPKGIIIMQNYICLDCEKQIKGIQVNDGKYDFYMNGFKKMWRCVEL